MGLLRLASTIKNHDLCRGFLNYVEKNEVNHIINNRSFLLLSLIFTSNNILHILLDVNIREGRVQFMCKSILKTVQDNKLPNKKKKDYGIGAVNVPLAVLWVKPGKKRDHDDLILGENTNPDAWADGMDDEMRLWLVGKVETQALLGERVVILQRKGSWLKVAAVSQRTEKNKEGYPGWVPAVQISMNSVYLSEQLSRPQVVVAVRMAELYEDKNFSKMIYTVSYQTRLPILSEEDNCFSVRLPNGETGYLEKSHVKKVKDLNYSGSDVVEQAKKFLGLKYIWGGTSAWGFDCSGFTFRVYQSQGVSIPRDSQEQALEGTFITKQDMLPGDLVFFADNNVIHHVGINIGYSEMIHSPNSRSLVRVESFDTEYMEMNTGEQDAIKYSLFNGYV